MFNFIEEILCMSPSVSTPEQLICQIRTDTFCKAIFSSRVSTQLPRKIVLESLRDRYKVESFEANQCFTSILSVSDLASFVDKQISLFKQVDLFFTNCSCHVNLKENGWRSSWTKGEKREKEESHNRIKPYLFKEGEIHPFLVALGVTDSHGKVIPPMRRKFVQINAFLEAIHDLLDHVCRLNKPLRIVDAGCGKAYLTFALATYLGTIQGLQFEVIGIDSREDVISKALSIRDTLKYHALDFRSATIGSFDDSSPLDLLICLHACNTATDVALFKAVQKGAEAIAVAPCCQHELCPLIPPHFLPILFDHPILAQKTASLLTDAFRCELLGACGYSVKAIEFVDPEHTPKNILLKAVKQGECRPLRKEFCEVRGLLPSGILLERLLKEHGFLKQ